VGGGKTRQICMNKFRTEPIILPPDEVVNVDGRADATSSWVVPGRKIDPINSFRMRPWLSLGLVFGILALGILLALLLAPRTYRAEAMIRVTPTYVAPLSLNSEVRFDSGIEYRNYVSQQIYEIQSHATVVKALSLLGPERELFQQPNETDRRAAQRLIKRLEVRALPDSYLVGISLEGSNPAGTADLVNAVARAYLARHREQDKAVNVERSQQLAERKSRLEEQIHLRSEQLGQIARELGTSSFDSETGNPYEKVRADTTTSLSRAKEALIKTQSRLAALKAERAHPEALVLNAAAANEAIDKTAESNGQQTTLGNGGPTDAAADLRGQREAAFLELRGLAPGHPGRKALEAKIADIDAEIKRLRGDDFSSVLEAAETSVQEAQLQEQGIEGQLASLDKQAAWFASRYNDGLEIQSAIRRDQKEVQDIDGRLNFVLTDVHAPGIVQLEASAPVPDLPEKGKRRKIALVFVLLGLVLGAAVPNFIELTDRRVRTVRELEEIIGIPALGVARLDGESERASSRDMLRRMALAILRERRASGNRVFVLTSVDKGGGTTSLALALERELSQFGANAVALEANPLSPDPRYLHSNLLDGGHGSAVSNGAISKYGEPANTLQRHINGSERNSLPHITVVRPEGDIEIVPELLQRLLDEQLAQRDIVLLDAAPLLESADTEMLIKMPAATILIVRAGHDRVERIKTAAEAISRIAPPVVGAVLLHHRSANTTVVSKPEAHSAQTTVRVNGLRIGTEATLDSEALASLET
jgi:succinoglycan biosynthesis transport protein ExoP